MFNPIACKLRPFANGYKRQRADNCAFIAIVSVTSITLYPFSAFLYIMLFTVPFSVSKVKASLMCHGHSIIYGVVRQSLSKKHVRLRQSLEI